MNSSLSCGRLSSRGLMRSDHAGDEDDRSYSMWKGTRDVQRPRT